MRTLPILSLVYAACFALWIASVSGCAGKHYAVTTPAPGCDYWYDKDHVRGYFYIAGPVHVDLLVKQCYGGL